MKSNGQFLALAEPWCCDQCGEAIEALMQCYVFVGGPQKGQCHCIRCAIDPMADGASERLNTWRSSPDYSPLYETNDPDKQTLVAPGNVLDSREKWPEGQSSYDPLGSLRSK